jgi:hypothetical protein
MITLWINKKTLVDLSAIDSNVEWSKIEPTVEVTQLKRIRPVLGNALYDAIELMIENYVTASTPIPVDYKKLLDKYIQPVIVNYLISDNALLMQHRLTNKGVMNKDSANSTPIDSGVMDLFRQEVRANAEVYLKLLIDYLKENLATYPEYKLSESPQQNSYAVSWFLD